MDTQLDTIERITQSSQLLYSQAQIDATIDRMCEQITQELADKNPLLLCVMQGGIIFTGALLLRLNFPLQLDYIHVTRYHGTTQAGLLHWQVKPTCSLKDRVVLIVDDILDKGLTLAELIDHCQQGQAKDVYTAVLVDKNTSRHQDGIQSADFTGVSVDNHYVYGYGMDYESYLRNVPGIYAVKEASNQNDKTVCNP